MLGPNDRAQIPVDVEIVLVPYHVGTATWPSPLVLLTTHRSGGTLLTRLYNLHPDIFIWGEHGGILNKLAEMKVIFDHHYELYAPIEERKIEEFIELKSQNAEFSPWINPVTREEFTDWCRSFIDRTFTKYLRPTQRWGIKEIRYHTLTTAQFLMDIFPSCQFVVLRRDLVEQCASNIFVEWSMSQLQRFNAGASKAEARRVVEDCAYALVSIDRGLARIADVFSREALCVDYQTLAVGSEKTLKQLYGFAGLRFDPTYFQQASRLLAVRSGPTPTEGVGYITADFVKEYAPEAISNATIAIEMNGIDMGRLRGSRYSFLVGDHAMLESSVSTIF